MKIIEKIALAVENSLKSSKTKFPIVSDIGYVYLTFC